MDDFMGLLSNYLPYALIVLWVAISIFGFAFKLGSTFANAGIFVALFILFPVSSLKESGAASDDNLVQAQIDIDKMEVRLELVRLRSLMLDIEVSSIERHDKQGEYLEVILSQMAQDGFETTQSIEELSVMKVDISQSIIEIRAEIAKTIDEIEIRKNSLQSSRISLNKLSTVISEQTSYIGLVELALTLVGLFQMTFGGLFIDLLKRRAGNANP
jgi:hypothetical protein